MNQPLPSEPTRREEALLKQLREVDENLGQLRSRRAALVNQLNATYPQARAQLKPVPKDRGVIISIFNYESEHHSALITLTAKGKKMLDSFDPRLKDLDLVVLALVSTKPEGADLTKLLAVPLIHADKRAKSKINKLDQFGYVDIKYTSK